MDIKFSMKKKIGIIVEGYICSKQIYDLVLLSKEAINFEITHLVINTYDEKDQSKFCKVLNLIRDKGIIYIISSILFKIIFEVEKRLFLTRNIDLKFFQKCDLRDFNLDEIFISPNISKNKVVYRYDQKYINQIRYAQLDLLIRAGNGILKGEILNSCPKGIVSFHHGNNHFNRGGPPGFWEVFLKQDTTGFIIQRLTDELDGGDILFRGEIPTLFNYVSNLVALQRVANPYMVDVIDDLFSVEPRLTIEEKIPYSYPLYKKPLIKIQIQYLLKTVILVFSKLLNRILRRRYRWSVAYQFTNNWKDAVLWKSIRIKNPINRFLADPFVIHRKGEHYCFLEDYDYALCRGRISVYKINMQGYEDLGLALNEDFHLSYPFIFEFDGEIYMCPETHEANDVRIYKCIEFPLDWKLEKIILKNIKSAYTNIFQKNGKWWLMTSVAKSNEADCSSTLHIYMSDNPITDEWVPHKFYPVIFDPRRARNAGLIIENNEIFRVNQRQGFDSYGVELAISRIESINSNEYIEYEECSVYPNYFPDLKGTHTFNFSEGLLVFDYLKKETTD